MSISYGKKISKIRNTIWFVSLGFPRLVCKGYPQTPGLSLLSQRWKQQYSYDDNDDDYDGDDDDDDDST